MAQATGDHLSDCIPLISAASLGKLRLVRLLLEGGAQVNGRNPRGETPLLAACKALRGEPTGPETVKLLNYLFKNQADPNAQDLMGRTPLIYACMERAGAQVASTLLAAGADPSIEDYSGASALVYAINAQDQAMLKVLMEACRAKGCDVIIIATEMDVNDGPVTKRYLNVPPSPHTSPVSCMSPSDIVLKTGSPSSPERGNIFNFRGTSQQGGSSSSLSPGDMIPAELSGSSTPAPRQRMWSEPWLAIHNLTHLNKAYEENMRQGGLHKEGGENISREAGGGEDEEKGQNNEEINPYCSRAERKRREGLVQDRESRNRRKSDEDYHDRSSIRVSLSRLSLTEDHSCQASGYSTSYRMTPKSSVDKLPPCCPPHVRQVRRNTLPYLDVIPPALHLPPLADQSDSHLKDPSRLSPSKGRSVAFEPHPPSSDPQLSSVRTPLRPALLPPLHLASSIISPPASLCCEMGQRHRRRHSVQL